MRASRWAVTGLLLLGCDPGAGNSPVRPPVLPLVGADISALERIEQEGALFYDGGPAGDVIGILRNHGYNLFRLRVFVSPSGAGVEVNDLGYTIRLAQRVKNSRATLLLDLHYSDTWADPAHQAVPDAWKSLDLDQLEEQVESYTAGVLGALDSAGATADIVQLGNEIDAGMLWPLGQLSPGSDSLVQWEHLARLIMAGARGVQAATPTAAIMLHLSHGGDSAATRWFFDHVRERGVPFDLIGLSYYPWWHGPMAQLKANLRVTAERYQREVMVVETSYPWRAGGWDGMAPDRSAMVWPATRSGQAAFLHDLAAAVESTPGGRGAGVAWWYPEAIQVDGLFVFGGGSLALFDDGGNALPAVTVFDSE